MLGQMPPPEKERKVLSAQGGYVWRPRGHVGTYEELQMNYYNLPNGKVQSLWGKTKS